MSKTTCQFRRMNELAELSPHRRILLWVAVLSGLLLAMLGCIYTLFAAFVEASYKHKAPSASVGGHTAPDIALRA